MEIIKNIYRPTTFKLDSSFQRFGTEIKKIIIKYPITNYIWSVYGEEFITSPSKWGKDELLTDPWCRKFSDEMCNRMKTIELPEKHVKITTSVGGIGIICNVYVRPLNWVDIDCRECEGEDFCPECLKTLRKRVYFPQIN